LQNVANVRRLDMKRGIEMAHANVRYGSHRIILSSRPTSVPPKIKRGGIKQTKNTRRSSFIAFSFVLGEF